MLIRGAMNVKRRREGTWQTVRTSSASVASVVASVNVNFAVMSANNSGVNALSEEEESWGDVRALWLERCGQESK